MTVYKVVPAEDVCIFCKKKEHSLLCDFPTGVITTTYDFKPTRTTCSRPMCVDCATHIDDDTDFCPRCMEYVKTLKKGNGAK